MEPKITLQSDKLAFLIPARPSRKDTMHPRSRDEFRNWLTLNRHQLPPSTVLITEVIRASGYVGGVALGHKTSISADIGADASVGRLTVGAAGAFEMKQASERLAHLHSQLTVRSLPRYRGPNTGCRKQTRRSLSSSISWSRGPASVIAG